ncbi:MAG: aminotransferase class IV [Bryobacteraceae bacterium]
MHPYLLHNESIHKTDEALLSPGQVGFMNGWGIFSTLRVTGGVLFAFERHYARMRRDAERMRVPFEIAPADLSRLLSQLVEANKAEEATLRVAVVRNRGGLFECPGITRNSDLVAFTADLNQWGNGVKLGYMPNARYSASPFAGTKYTSWAQNLTWYELAHERGLDEFILLNERGLISECTSANVFCIQGDTALTPPLESSGCLAGVTRAVLMEEVSVPGFAIRESELAPADLERSECVFITSTTRDLLPVLQIDGVTLQPDLKKLLPLQQAFLDYRTEYVRKQQDESRVLVA